MVTSYYFTPEVEMWPFRACTMKNMHYRQIIKLLKLSTECICITRWFTARLLLPKLN